jgi:hypothetical protein
MTKKQLAIKKYQTEGYSETTKGMDSSNKVIFRKKNKFNCV